ncbi:Inositol-1-monophosphatase [Thalassovita autumnalis]|uniref:Inositol-1-monophosphatase n=2 Tax=Thalassovita autumnalis TaxID=2072972 RepID=A0A0P1G977_9RHOB|nr:Inositol-1-monophosphatase [Thalassovita autumnalis]CUH71433.1 Inositol-1-monophosphatase [Thalassovita autumnalis]
MWRPPDPVIENDMSQATPETSVEMPAGFDPEESAQLRAVAIAAAMAVAPGLKAAFRSKMVVDFKNDLRDIVTEHDRAAEVAITEHLLAAVPQSEVLGEEGGLRGSGPVRWYVDPIDGTANFARGLPNWCISIGAVVDGQIVAGVIVDPMGGNVFSADLRGAYLNDAPMRSNAAQEARFATLISSYPAARDFAADGKAAALEDFGQLVEGFSSVRRNGSAALGLAHVAAGWADAAAGFGINAWDVTAAVLILRQSGGRYLPFAYGQTPAAEPAFVHPGYIAIGGGGDYPFLSQTWARIAASRS